MSEKRSEKSKMSSVEFVQSALRDRVAPPLVGSVKARLRHAARALGWSQNRVKDAWYADPRISISAEEIRKIEEITGLRYGREELHEIDELIGRAGSLLARPDENSGSAILAALRALVGALDRPGTGP